MTRSTLRWWLWSSLSGVVLVIAGIFGLYPTLLRNDITYISFVVIAAYLLSTAWLGWKQWTQDRAYAWIWYIAENMERAGIFGTFVGLAVAFSSLGHMDAAGLWKQELMLGVSTKFMCSLVGMAGAFLLKTQVKILDPDYEG